MRMLLLTLFVVCSLSAVDRTFPVTEDPKWMVIDGDTVDVSLDLGFDLSKRISLRIGGVDAPEIRPLVSREAATVSKQFVEHWIKKHKGKIKVHIVKYQGKFGRPIGDLVSGSETLSAYLLKQGVAVKYGESEKLTAEMLKKIAAKQVPK